MPCVKVEYLPLLPEITGKRTEQVQIEHPTLKSLLAALDLKYGERWQAVLWAVRGKSVSPHVMIVVDGQLVHKLSTPLAEDSMVVITPAVSGG